MRPVQAGCARALFENAPFASSTAPRMPSPSQARSSVSTVSWPVAAPGDLRSTVKVPVKALLSALPSTAVSAIASGLAATSAEIVSGRPLPICGSATPCSSR
ncbi:hypothetical protein D9M72_343840 [compost metagenome]